MPFLWRSFLSIPANQQPFYSGFQSQPQQAVTSASAGRTGQQQQQQQSQPSSNVSSDRNVAGEVARVVRAVLGQDIGCDVPLVQAGIDSLGTPSCGCPAEQQCHESMRAAVLNSQLSLHWDQMPARATDSGFGHCSLCSL